MSDVDIKDRLKDIKIEEFIWFIYIGIIILSFYSNSLEKKYYLFNDVVSKEKYRNTLILIFSILLIVYLYFLKDAYDEFKSLKQTDSSKRKELVTLSFIGSLLIALSGFIFLYVAFSDKNIDVELAFN